MMVHSETLALLRRLRRGVLLAVLAIALPGLALGQLLDDAEEPEEEVEEIRRYTVELIVFEYANTAMSGSEIFLPEEPLVDEELLLLPPRTYGDPGTFVGPDVPVAIDDVEFNEEEELAFLLPEEPEEEQILEEVPSHMLHTRLEMLDPEEYAMKDIYEKLVELGAYTPLMRAAWTQATYEKDQTLPLRLRRLGNAPLRLDGTVMLYLSRYLHLVVDLTIESEQERSGYGNEPETTKIKYTISEDRIFRNGELRYYDHPKFGVLARITRVEEEEPETDEMFLLPGDPAGEAVEGL
jgi:hypothetical protein